MVPTFDLAPVQLAGEGCDVGVGRVTPDIGEVRIEGKISLGSNDLPRLELLDHRSNVLGLVTNVVFFYMFRILQIDVRNDGFDSHGIDHLLKSVLLPVDLVVLLDLDEIAPLGVVLNFWIEELGPFDAPAFEALDPDSETHFGLGVHEQEKTVLASPFGGSKMAL